MSSYLEENLQLKNEISKLSEKVQDLTMQAQNLEQDLRRARRNPFNNIVRGFSNLFGTQQPEEPVRASSVMNREYQFESDAWHLRRGRSSFRGSRRGSHSSSGRSSSGSGSRGRRYSRDPY